jgi:CBS-domain-containing membrane protein
LKVLPVLDEGGRIIGLVDQGDMLKAVGDMLSLSQTQTEKPAIESEQAEADDGK